MLCTSLLGASLTDKESLQVTCVGTEGLKHIIAVCDHSLNLRCTIANPSFLPIEGAGKSLDEKSFLNVDKLFGENCQIQVTRNHPSYKEPSTGIIQMQSGDIPFNMGIYLQGSEQRKGAFLTKVRLIAINDSI